MKNLILFIVLIIFAGTVSSCGSEANQNAKSIHVDSSNVNGTAPVRYGPDNPADTTASLQSSDDTGRRANTDLK